MRKNIVLVKEAIQGLFQTSKTRQMSMFKESKDFNY